MDVEFKAKVQERIESYLDAIESSGEFVVEQAPLVAQEYINWVFWQSTIYACVFAVASVATIVPAAVISWKMWKAEKKDVIEKGLPPLSPFPVAVGVILSFIFLVPLVINLMSATKAVVAPRVVLLEQIRELLP